MPKFLLTTAALFNGEIVNNSYSFESNLLHTEDDLIQSYQEFYSGHTDVRILSFVEIASNELVPE